jgi:hypothetical protein
VQFVCGAPRAGEALLARVPAILAKSLAAVELSAIVGGQPGGYIEVR